MSDTNKQSSGRLQMILVGLVFLGPLAVAAWMYFGPNEYRPGAGTNNGELLDPVITLPAVAMRTPGQETLVNDIFRGKWSLAYLNYGPCEQLCEQTLIKIRQIRLATGKEAHRVQRVYLANTFPADTWLTAGHAGLISAQLDSAPAIREALASFTGGLYLIDPLGNVMMRYPLETEPKPIYTDLKKLLKFSRIG